MKYGQSIIWHDFDGARTEYNIDGCDTPEEARQLAIEAASYFGWTPPKWWQWWRWDDTRITE